MNLMHKHILVVDDNHTNVELLLDLLDAHDFQNVHGISDPRHVLPYCQRQLPDLILLDIRMPHMDGYAVFEQLQGHFTHHTPPTIVLTAQTDNETRHRRSTWVCVTLLLSRLNRTKCYSAYVIR